MRDVLDTLRGMIRKKDRYEKMEGYSILFLIVGALILSLGIGLSALNPKGLSAVLAMLGALTSFLATVSLIFVWLLQELTSD